MASKRCPRCKLVNPASAERCDCGTSFVDGSVGASLADRMARAKGGNELERRQSAGRLMAIGAVIAVLGIVITVATFATATSTGGSYLIAYGPIVAGTAMFIRGAMRR